MTGRWQIVSGVPILGPREVHVWRVDLGPEVAIPAEAVVLSADERARAARFHRAPDRARSIASRVALRTLLGEYTGEAPAAFRFEAESNGKPALAPGSAHGAPRFNVAHSGRLVLLAFARCDVGIDVEMVREGTDSEALARRFFAPDEIAALDAAPAPERVGRFFRIWTRKEAFLKARGMGLSSPLDSFTTTSSSGAALPAIPWEGGRGYLCDLEPGNGYAGAVVTAGPARVSTLEFTP